MVKMKENYLSRSKKETTTIQLNTYCLVVVNMCLAFERICYFLCLFPLLLFTFQTVPLFNGNIK